MARRSRRPSEAGSTGWGGFGSFNEAFRILRSNLSVALSDLANPVVIVTSSKANEGKTITCSKLAASFATAGLRVVLVDLDLRHSTTHQVVGGHNEFGVTDVLLGRKSLDDCLQYIEMPHQRGDKDSQGFYFLGTGPAVNNPTELLGLGRTARMLESLSGQADLVLLDTPPVLPVADTLVIGRMAAGAVLVVETRRTAVGAVQQAKELLIRNQTRLLGIVLNKFEAKDANFSYGYYGYGYGYGNRTQSGPVQESDSAADLPSAANGSITGNGSSH